MRIVFSGSIGRLPFGGHAWVDMQYLIGLQRLGHEVLYLEECGPESWVYNWRLQDSVTELDYPANYVRDCLEPIGFARRWIYRAGEHSRGMERESFVEFCAEADLLLIRGAGISLWRPEYECSRRKAFIDSDPLFTQVHLARGKPELVQTIQRCQRLFTVGQRLGDPDCPAPTRGREWIKIVPPVALCEWPYAQTGPASHFTAVMQWKSYKEVEWNGTRYGNKDKEFSKFIDLPGSTDQRFQLALTGARPERISGNGWEIVEGWRATETTSAYREFIQGSRAEFGVGKQGYVATQCGWFSDRSVCYLASGRPVLVQDTGLGDWLPLGQGVQAFKDPGEALRGIQRINADYEAQRRAARRLAEDVFATEKVLPGLLEAAVS